MHIGNEIETPSNLITEFTLKGTKTDVTEESLIKVMRETPLTFVKDDSFSAAEMQLYAKYYRENSFSVRETLSPELWRKRIQKGAHIAKAYEWFISDENNKPLAYKEIGQESFLCVPLNELILYLIKHTETWVRLYTELLEKTTKE